MKLWKIRSACKMIGRENQTITTQMTATVVGGLLRPDENLQLAEQTRVNLTIEPIAEKIDPVDSWESVNAFEK